MDHLIWLENKYFTNLNMKGMKNGSGYVLSYDEINEEHKITYNNEEDCYFNLMDDLSQNDLIIIN